MSNARKKKSNPLLQHPTLHTPENRVQRGYESGGTSAARTERGFFGSDSTLKKTSADKRHSRNFSKNLNSTHNSSLNPMKSPEATDLFKRYRNAATRPFCPRKASIKDLYELHRTLSRDLTKTKKLIKISEESVVSDSRHRKLFSETNLL